MSTSRGNSSRKRPQKYQNKTAFKNDLHDTSIKTKTINSLEVAGVCMRCKSIIEWKIKYKKYKPLSAPRKCVACEQKTIKYAYHVLCVKCSTNSNKCAKCCKQTDKTESEETVSKFNHEIESLLKQLPERKRRTLLRHIEKERHEGQELPSEFMLRLEDMVADMDKISLGIEDDSDNLSDLEEYDSDNHNNP